MLIGLVEIVAVADNDSRLTGEEIEGVRVIAPEHIVEYSYDYVVVTPIFFDEISKQLISLGVENEKILPYYKGYKRNFGPEAREFLGVKIGRYSYYKPGTKLHNCEIGKFCHIGDGCTIGLYGHDTSIVTTYPLKYHFSNSEVDVSKDNTVDAVRKFKKTVIKNDVYIGEGVIIMADVTVGNGAVIGSKAIVTKDVPDYCVAAGIPAKVVKKRFSDEIIDALLKIEWWAWSESRIQEHIDDFESDVESFVAVHGKFFD